MSDTEKLERDLQHHRRMVEVLNSVSSQINTSLDINSILQNVFELLHTYFGFEYTMILLTDDNEPNELTLKASYGYNNEGDGAKVMFGQGIIGTVAKNKRLIRMANMRQMRTYAQLIAKDEKKVELPGIKDCASQLAVPLLTGDDLLGVLSVESKDVSQFQRNDESLLRMIGTQIAIAIKNARQYDLIDQAKQELQNLNENLESKVAVRTRLIDRKNKELETANEELQQSLNHLRQTQEKLVQSEKLAALGQLTSGIAHEIQNPLNFVNNFSELNNELIDEQLEEIEKGDLEEIKELAIIIKENSGKINDHGKRADSIVKAMLQHSKGSDGKKESTNLNALVKEYVNLSYHGMRAGKNPINVDLEFDLDESIGKVPLIAEDFSRVIVNLANNAFDACREKLSISGRLSAIGHRTSVEGDAKKDAYAPKVRITTKPTADGRWLIAIEDNGPGIPDEIKDKILQPFFTTKKGTEGTGLGLSITNDIIKAHGGELVVSTIKNEKTVFSIRLPK